MKSKGGGPHNFKGGEVRHARKAGSVAENNRKAAEWAELSPSQQLAALDRRLGKGVGARKQRARIAAKLRRAA